ncbi:tRNA:m(4)X modification enzyme [Sarracenia purpurea var. burkii]
MGVKDFVRLNNPSSGPWGSITSEMKRNAVYSLTTIKLSELIGKIQFIHSSICKDIQDSYKIPEACGVWTNKEVDGKLPFQEKHVLQQASILGNLEEFGVLKNSVGHIYRDNDVSAGSSSDVSSVPAVVEFGAGRGYLTQMLADCYGIRNVFLVERKSYKLKADRSLRQNESLILERLRIDIEDLNLNAVEPLQGIPYLAIGKHLCGPATDMTLRCCLAKKCKEDNVAQYSAGPNLRGLGIATCCHHLCQWKHYINKRYLSNLGITKEDFHTITWFTSWAVDADHSSDLSDGIERASDLQITEMEDCSKGGVESIFRDWMAVERAALGFMCKDIIDMGRLVWIKDHGLEARVVKYVPSRISPENHLLIAKGDGNL